MGSASLLPPAACELLRRCNCFIETGCRQRRMALPAAEDGWGWRGGAARFSAADSELKPPHHMQCQHHSPMQTWQSLNLAPLHIKQSVAAFICRAVHGTPSTTRQGGGRAGRERAALAASNSASAAGAGGTLRRNP